MALKFLNKKGWHTGSLRNIENVWKAEQKRDAEEKKLEELRKQIHEERGRAEFRQLQIDSGLIPKQERLEFLYDSGLAVGKGSSNFKALESAPKTEPDPIASASTSAKQQSAAPGALFEEKPQTANDAWRKLHSDPLLLIRQREQESLARVKNNPVQMAMIRKSVEAQKSKDKDENKHGKKHRRKKSKHRKHSSSENDSDYDDSAPTVEKGKKEVRHRDSRTDKPSSKTAYSSDEGPSSEEDARRKKHYDKDYKDKSEDQQRSNKSYHNSRREEYSSERPIESRHDNRRSHLSSSDKDYKDKSEDQHRSKKSYHNSRREEYSSERQTESRRDNKRSRLSSPDKDYKDKSEGQQRSNKSYHNSRREEYSSERPTESRDDIRRSHFNSSDKPPRNESGKNRHRNPIKLSEEERAARLREMEMDAERHEQQRWKRIKKAADSDAQEANRDHASLGRNFIDAAQKSIYGAEKGGSSTIEESVRRRAHYLQRREPTDSNAFRRS